MERIAVIGCGTMGHSIALNAAWAGFNVRMHGISNSEIDQGLDNMYQKLDVLFEHGLVEQTEVQQIKGRIETAESIERVVKDASLVIEAIPENIELKRPLFKQLDHLCGTDVVLASNTSGLSPSDIAKDTVHPERVIVTHFWNPAHLVPLVEIVPGEHTNQDTIDRSHQLMMAMKKEPIKVNKEIPGFVGNRLQYALFREAQYIYEEGIASKEDIDAAVTYSIGRRLPVTGPLMTADMGGLDVFSAISNYLFADLSNADQSLPALRQLVEDNQLGDKTGEGYYTWDTPFSERMNHQREKELIRFLKQDMGIH